MRRLTFRMMKTIQSMKRDISEFHVALAKGVLVRRTGLAKISRARTASG